MKNVILKKWLAIGTSVAVCLPAGSQTPEEEMRQLVRQLDLLVPDQVVRDQAEHLSPAFRRQFRTKSQLKSQNIQNYFMCCVLCYVLDD